MAVQKITGDIWKAALSDLGLWQRWQADYEVARDAAPEGSNVWTPTVLRWLEQYPRVKAKLDERWGAGKWMVTGMQNQAQIQPRTYGDGDSVEQMVAMLRPSQRAAYEALMAAAKGKSAVKPGKQMDWAFNHWALDWEAIDPAGVPDVGALGSLLAMKFDKKVYHDCLAKRSGTTAQMQKEQEAGGDDADAMDLFEVVAATLKGTEVPA